MRRTPIDTTQYGLHFRTRQESEKGILMGNQTTNELLKELRKIDAYDAEFIPVVMSYLDNEEDQEVVLDFIRNGAKYGQEVSYDTITMLSIYLDEERHGIDGVSDTCSAELQ